MSSPKAVGPKITVHETPPAPPASETASETVVRAAQEEVVVKDKKGRVLTVRKANFMAKSSLLKMIGHHNDRYIDFASATLYLAAIDGEGIIQPATERQLDALMQRLDQHGYDALRDAIQDNFIEDDEEAFQEAVKK